MSSSPADNKELPRLESVELDETKLLSAAQLVFAEKRTALSLMRTGISVLALPLAVVSALIATSKYYNTADILHLLIPVMALNACLVVLGIYLVTRSVLKIRREERLLRKLKCSHPALAPYFD